MDIRTSRLKIRPFIESDIDDVFEIYSNEEVCKYLLHEPWTIESKDKSFKKKLEAKSLESENGIRLACELEGKVIGEISVWYTGMKETVEIGIGFNSRFSNRGYGSEAMMGVINYLFQVENIHRIQANLDARNIGSSNLCKKIGMRREGHFIKDYWSKGEWTDSYIYGMLKSDLISN